MPSIIPGYEYDIFISYRQKDNRPSSDFGLPGRSGWVSEFVNSLKSELDATFKEDVSIYFDENPHDGLLETHDVNESLKGKLKCLIFIPIVSQTYCDPKSFAWEHEFRAFVSQSTQDHFGLKIKLSSGNTANRVLPVRIHELEAYDIKLFESAIQSVLRPIDFVFKSSGVNRPLLPSDKKEENSNRHSYRDQINKVANAVKEIINSLKGSNPSSFKIVEATSSSFTEYVQPRSRKTFSNAAGALLVLGVVAFLAYYFSYKKDQALTASKSSIAVIPFRNNTGDQSKDVFGVGIASEVSSQLSLSRQFDFISSLQATIQYQHANDSPIKIGEDLKVTHILSGIFQTASDNVQVLVELVDAESGKVIWSLPYQTRYDDLFTLQRGIASKVMEKFSITSPIIEHPTTKNIEAYYNYMKGHDLMLRTNDLKLWLTAIPDFKKAIALDSSFLAPWAEIAGIYGFYYVLSPEDSSITIDTARPYIDYIESHFPDSWEKKDAIANFRFFFLGDLDGALQLLQQVLKENPEDPRANIQVSIILRRKLALSESVRLLMKNIKQNPTRLNSWSNLMGTLRLMGDMKNYKKVVERIYHLRNEDWAELYFYEQMSKELEQLPVPVKKQAGHQYQADLALQKGDYRDVIRQMNSIGEDSVFGLRSKYYYKGLANHLQGADDSARYYAKHFFQTPEDKFSLTAVFEQRTMNSILKKEENVMDDINHQYSRRNEKVDLSTQWDKKVHKVFHYTLSSQYSKANELLQSMNRDYRQVGWYQWLNLHYFDRIKREYPIFQKTISEIKYPTQTADSILSW